MDELFAPPAYAWIRLSPNYRRLRRLTTLLVAPIVFSIPAVIIGVASGMWWISAILWGFAAVIVIIRLALVERNYRSWGYVEREDDLYITHGVLYRSLVAVPYGRMQLVEVGSGPLERGLRSRQRHPQDRQLGDQRHHSRPDPGGGRSTAGPAHRAGRSARLGSMSTPPPTGGD